MFPQNVHWKQLTKYNLIIICPAFYKEIVNFQRCDKNHSAIRRCNTQLMFNVIVNTVSVATTPWPRGKVIPPDTKAYCAVSSAERARVETSLDPTSVSPATLAI